MSDPKNPDELRAEIAKLDDGLRNIAARERAADAAIASLTLAAWRGDKKAETKIEKHEATRTGAINWQRRLRAARVLMEAELECNEAAKAKADATQTDLTVMENANV